MPLKGSCRLIPVALLFPALLQAQGLPLFHQVNPVVESRSGLYFQPLRPAKAGLSVDIGLDYGSAIETAVNTTTLDTTYLLDAELLRLNVALRRDLGPANYVAAEVFVGGSYDGFLDKVVDAYHSLLGIEFPEREARPSNQFAYRLIGPDGALLTRDKSAI